MKEASGELSMTAIAIVAIAALGVIFTTLVWPAIKEGLRNNARCSQAFACSDCNNGAMTCSWTDEDGVVQNGLTCACDITDEG